MADTAVISERLRREAPLAAAHIERLLRDAAAAKEGGESPEERGVGSRTSTPRTKNKRSGRGNDQSAEVS